LDGVKFSYIGDVAMGSSSYELELKSDRCSSLIKLFSDFWCLFVN